MSDNGDKRVNVKGGSVHKSTRHTAESIGRELERRRNWTPNNKQEAVKTRFYRRLGELQNKYDLQYVLSNQEAMIEVAQTVKIIDWMGQPAFKEWFLDFYFLEDRLRGLKGQFIDKLEEILTDVETPAGDLLKAGRFIWEATGSMPDKNQRIIIGNDRIDKMEEAEVIEAERELDKQLKQLSTEGHQSPPNDVDD